MFKQSNSTKTVTLFVDNIYNYNGNKNFVSSVTGNFNFTPGKFVLVKFEE